MYCAVCAYIVIPHIQSNVLKRGYTIIVRCGVEETTQYRKPRDLGCSVPSAARTLLQGPRLPTMYIAWFLMTTHLTILECSNRNQRRVKFLTNVRSKQTKWLAYRPTSSHRDVDRVPYRPKHGIRQRPHTAKETMRVPVGTASLLPHFSMRNKHASFQR